MGGGWSGSVGAVDIQGWVGGGVWCKIESLQILDLRRLAGMKKGILSNNYTYLIINYCLLLHLAGLRKWSPLTWYNEMLEKHPIRTKCITSGGVETGLILLC